MRLGSWAGVLAGAAILAASAAATAWATEAGEVRAVFSIAAPDASHPGWTPSLAFVPTREDVADAYPPEAKAAGKGGRTVMACRLSRRGEIVPCTVSSEDPPGLGFGEAAMKLAHVFLSVAPLVEGRPTGPVPVVITIDWSTQPVRAAPAANPSPPAPTSGPTAGAVVGVTWKRRPGYTDFVGTYPANAYETHLPGKVSLTCTAGADGKLKLCKVVREAPAGYGFGKAALRIAGVAYRLAPTASDGGGVEGLELDLGMGWAPGKIEMYTPDTATRAR